MPTLSVQFQPKRAPGVAPVVVTTLMARLADALPAVREFTFQRGSDRGPYINYFFESRSPRHVWRLLRTRAFANRRLGAKLRRASIVTCQGSRGWDNYLLLHHFDKKVVLDKMADV